MSDLTAREEGFKNALERNLGKEEYKRIGEKGHDDPDEKGRWSAREVISEVRNSDKSPEEMKAYFKELRKDGAKFNKRALAFLDRFEADGDGSGGDNTSGLSKQAQGAIERSAAYRDRMWSGEAAQDIYGKSKTLAEGNTLGINVETGLQEDGGDTGTSSKAADALLGKMFGGQDEYRFDARTNPYS